MSEVRRHTVYLGLGSNLGDRSLILRRAVSEIATHVGSVTAESRVMESAPVDFVSEHPFLNQVIRVESYLSTTEVLRETQRIERALGREVKSQGGVHHDRTCDIDILVYDDVVMTSDELTIPHPKMKERDFVMLPLSEIAPDLTLPDVGMKVKEVVWGD